MEQWKQILWYEGLYEVSNKGRVKSLKNWVHWVWKERILKVWKNYSYSRVLLTKQWRKNFKVNRLVAIAFIPNPLNLPLVCHKDETLDERWLLYNWSDNLFWWTHSDNAKDSEKKWRSNNHFKTNNPSKLWILNCRAKSVNQFSKDWEFIKEWWSQKDVERELRIYQTWVSNCCLWKQKTAGWFIWKYT